MRLISTFIGEERGGRSPLTTREEVLAAHSELATGDGWGQHLVGTAAELASVGAYEIAGGEWLLDLDGSCLGCRLP